MDPVRDGITLKAISPTELVRLARAVVASADASEVARSLFLSCKRVIGATRGYVAIMDPRGDTHEVVIVSCGGDALMTAVGRRMPNHRLAEAARERESAIFHNDFPNSEWAPLLPAGHISLDNVLLAPLVDDEKLIGLLCLANKTGGFSADDAELVMALGELAGVALSNRETLELLERNEGLFRALSDSSPIGIYIVQDRRFQFVNPQFQQLTGYSEQELLGTDAFRLVHDHDREKVRERAIEMLKGGLVAPYEFRIITKTGELRWIMETVASFEYHARPAAVGNFIDVTDRKCLEHQLVHLATHDPLTGLPNRRALEEAMQRAVARARRGRVSTLMFLDLDNFKLVNDRLGHATGDQALVRMAELLRGVLRQEDILARLGGDEFAALLEGTSLADAIRVADRMRRCSESLVYDINGREFKLCLSCGLASIDGTDGADVVLSKADTAMYRAKEQGGNRIVAGEG